MGAHKDFLAIADRLGVLALEEVEKLDGGDAADYLRDMAQAGKAALEAAALAQDIGPGEIAEALDAIRDQLEESGYLSDYVERDTTEFLTLVFRTLVAQRSKLVKGRDHYRAYERLRELAVSLERDFTAADTDTSRRIAARIVAALDDAAEIIGTTGE